jgi:PAS domain S-box-containing protein
MINADGSHKLTPQASLHKLAALLHSAVDAIISIDDQGIIESINPATERLFGYSAAELVGQNVKLLMPDPDRSRHDAYIRYYLATGERKLIGLGREVVGQRKDGSTFPMHLSVSEYEIEGRRHFAGIVHDLSIQRQAEIEASRQQTLLQAIINDTPQGILIGDQNRTITLVNPAMTRLFGYTAEELLGRNARLLYASEEDYDRVGRLRLDPAIPAGRGEIEPLRVSFRRKNGETFIGEVIATVIRDVNANRLGGMAIIRDLTHQLRQDEVLRQAQRMEALGQLTGGIAHDFNNLLTVIMGNLELFETAGDAASGRELVREANDAAKMGARLTARLLGFSRQRQLNPVLLDINEQVNAMMDLLRRSIGETIAVSTSLAGQLEPILADPSEIENALLNLAINARDAMPNGGRLIIETQAVELASSEDGSAYGLETGRYVRVSVSDSGTGMPAHVVARAFEPYFTTKPAGRGTGLGLASIYGFVKQSGGNATIYSELGRGTTVNIYLPTIAAETESALEHPVDDALARAARTVLVVEDDAAVRRLAVRRLGLLGHRVLQAENGPAALALIDLRADIDLILSDVVMPGGMTGYELARQVRRKFPQMKILLTSGYDAELAAAQDLDASDLRLLRKPYTQAELVRALQETLEA